MSAVHPEAEQLRRTIVESIPADLFDNEPRHLYVSPDLRKALDPQRPLVIGDRGTGKTFLWSALASPRGPKLLTRLFGSEYEVRAAFGAVDANGFQRPGQDTVQLLFQQADARTVWKTFLLAAALDQPLEGKTWSERVRWVQQHPEASDLLLTEQDRHLQETQRQRLIVFDAIDRDPPDWAELVAWHRALLSILLDVQRLRALRVKVFARRDVVEAPEVGTFPDASKLRAKEITLRWTQKELYTLLWRYLAPSELFRRMASAGWTIPVEIPEELKNEEAAQRHLWHQLAGPYMGKTPQRGDTYRWLFNRLADAYGQVSPRSFLTAVRVAAEKTPPSSATAIHFSALHEGVKEAARTRALEIAEDFPWMYQALGALQETLVPCEREVIISAWRGANLEAAIDSAQGRKQRGSGKGLDELLDESINLHIFDLLYDGRVNVPDVFRLGFGMRRMGGVRP